MATIREYLSPAGCLIERSSWPVCASQTFVDVSLVTGSVEVPVTRLPSGLKPTLLRLKLAPLNLFASWRMETSQILTVPSPLPVEASLVPSGLNAKFETQPVCPLKL